MRRWQLCLALSVLASVVCAPVADASVSAEQGAGAIVSGLLADATDNPVAGAVELYAWPTGRQVEVGQAMQLVPVGHDRVTDDGLFRITGDLTPDLAELARLNGGYVNFVLQAAAAGVIEETHFSRYVGDTPITAQEAGRPHRPVEWRASPEESAEPVHMRLQNAPATSSTSGDRPIHPMQGGCWGLTLVEKEPRDTVIGELRAPLDTESAIFSYGKRSDSEIGVAGRAANGPWSLSGSFHVANAQEGEVTQRALSGEHLLVLSRFMYEKYEFNCPSGKRERVVPAGWMGDVHPQPTTVHGCRRTVEDNRGYYGAGGTFTRVKEKAVRWDGAVDAYGASLTARSGYSKYVKSNWSFGRDFRHILCGDDGPPAEAGHIFAGTSL
jgi:hypothetical protein